MKKLSSFFVALSLTGSALAQTAPTSTTSLRDLLKKSKFSTSLATFTETNRGENSDRVIGTANIYDVIVDYKVDANNKFTLLGEGTLSTDDEAADRNEKTTTSSMDVIEFAWTRSGILTEANNGINFGTKLTAGLWPNDKVRDKANTSGYVQARASVSKSFSDWYSLSSQYRIYQYLQNENQTVDKFGAPNGTDAIGRLLRHRVYLIQDISLSKKVGLSTTLRYQRDINERKNPAGGSRDKETYLLEQAVSYQISKDFSAALYAGNTYATSHDNDGGLTDDSWSRSWYGLNLNLTLF
jgi:hypothetical protein